MTSYRHTQRAKYILVALGVLGGSVVLIGAVKFPSLLIVMPILILTAYLFHSLTIEVAEGQLRWRFGPGLIRKSVALTEIASAKPVRTNTLEGWGIHYSRYGWLYNVSGFDAVAITLRNGKRFALGSDEPEKLAESLVQRAT